MRPSCLAVVLFLALLSCGNAPAGETTTSLRLAVTTSTRDSGLLELLLPDFEKKSGLRIDVLAVGTGAALALGKSKDVDLIIVHDRDAEKEFMTKGYGSRRAPLFTNQFVIIGPLNDPAGIHGMTPTEALLVLNRKGSKYVSRGDDSGTHRREKQLLRAAGLAGVWPNCTESGRGMGATLTMAHQMQAYALSDRATFLHFKPKIELKVLVENAPSLVNTYSAIVVKRDSQHDTQQEAANDLCDYLISPRVQERIRLFECLGERPFVPLALHGAKDN